MTYILGINSSYHESAACLLKDGEVVAFAEEERFTRVKHAKPARVDNPDELPTNAIDFCLNRAGIRLKDLDYFGFSFFPKDRLKKNTGLDNAYGLPGNSWGTEEGENLFYTKSLSIPEKLGEMAGQDISKRFHFLHHHLCHAASAFFVSPFQESAILIVDGIAESASTWLGYGKDNEIHRISEIHYPNSLGFLWEKMSEYLGFSEYDACKVMGLSSYGEAHKMMPEMKKLVHLNGNGTFEILNDIIKFRTPEFGLLEELFKTEKRTDTHLFAVHENIAAALQQVTEDAMIHLSEELYEKTGSKNISLAGGVALNCVANGKIVPNTGFENIFIQPAAHDSGTALGAAYCIWNQILGKPRAKPMTHAYLGPEYSEEEIREVLERNRMSYQRFSNPEKHLAQMISQGNIVAWFNGRMEAGPRALGNRSILADPRSPIIRDILNRKVKHREIFRPFCPSVLKEDAKDWFEINDRYDDPAHYMLIAYNMRAGKTDLIPAVTHADRTARIQLVSKESNERYYNLLSEFKKLTGIPVLLNTSFNIQEPIVCSPQDAVHTFERSGMDCLAMGDFVVEKQKSKK